jgi:membrane peptidoglycan carboxypeptidase
LYQGGLQITTTFDPELQKDADNAVDTAPLPDPIDSAIAVIDNSTGAVRAIANRRKFEPLVHEVDVATGNNGSSGKQPGSGFKVFTLAAALASGYSPLDYSKGGTCHFSPPQGTQLGDYEVRSDSGGGTLKVDIAKSVNCSFVNLEVSMGWGTAGPKKVAAMADRLGLSKDFSKDPYPFGTSLTLGTYPVTPLQMAAAYSTLANDGLRRHPTYVTKIVAADGSVLYDRKGGAPGEQVISQQNARSETAMLEDVISANGTAPQANIGRPAAGKTGTTTNGTDLWFTGYTPQLTASVWVGLEATESPLYGPGLNLLSESQAFGGSVSAPIWKTFMQAALQDVPVQDFNPPDEGQWQQGYCVEVVPVPGRKKCYYGSYNVPRRPTTTTTTPKGGHGKPPHGGGTGTTSPTTAPGPPRTGQ